MLAKQRLFQQLGDGWLGYSAFISQPFKENEREANRKEHSLASATRVQLLQGLGEASLGRLGGACLLTDTPVFLVQDRLHIKGQRIH